MYLQYTLLTPNTLKLTLKKVFCNIVKLKVFTLKYVFKYVVSLYT